MAARSAPADPARRHAEPPVPWAAIAAVAACLSVFATALVGLAYPQLSLLLERRGGARLDRPQRRHDPARLGAGRTLRPDAGAPRRRLAARRRGHRGDRRQPSSS